MSLWLVSYIVLWLVVFALALAVTVLLRQVGLLHLRFGPRGALAFESEGPPLDQPAETSALLGPPSDIREDRGVLTGPALVLFLSNTCHVCSALAPAIRAFARTAPGPVFAVCTGTDPVAEEEVVKNYEGVLGRKVVVLADSGLAHRWAVANYPYAVSLDSDLVVRGKGIVNSLEQIEELFAPALRGTAVAV